jgi:predicted aconitase with swiveling domain
MADPVNSDVERAFALIAGPLLIVDDQAALVAGSQAGALRVSGQMFVITKSVTQGAVVLPVLGTNDAAPVYIIINESPNTLRVGCGNATDTIGGNVTTPTFSAGFLNLVTRCSMVCVASQSPLGAGGGPTASPNNWHAAVLV